MNNTAFCGQNDAYVGEDDQWQSLGASNDQAKTDRLACPTPDNGAFDNIGENFCSSNLSDTKENAAADGPRNGVNSSAKCFVSQDDNTPNSDCYAIIDWANTFAELLSEAERVALAWAALRNLAFENAELTCKHVMGCAELPLPTFISPMSDARWGADHANRQELKAYALAAFEQMNEQDQTAFLAHVRGAA